MFFSFHMDYSDGEVALPECHRVKRKDMKLFCCFLDVFIPGFRSATVVGIPLNLLNLIIGPNRHQPK